MNFTLDEIDRQILGYLVENTRMPFTEIAKLMDVSAGTIHVRVKKLEEAKIILGSSLILDYAKLDYHFSAYIGILLDKSSKTKAVLDELAKIPNVVESSVISGEFNIFVKIKAKDTPDATRVIYLIDEIEGVIRTNSMITMQEHFSNENRVIQGIL